jgi:uncharacterized SAM-binding protein YcdF (DUF218 family)
MESSGGFFRSGWETVSLLVLAGVFLVVAIPLAGLIFANSLLVTRQEPRKTDVIVVLGGENKSRVEKTAELYKQGFAPRILVTGKNEDTLIRRSLVAAGVPKRAIWVEPSSISTFENASFSVPILEQWNVKSVLLVTSCIHSRRATAVFRSKAGKINIVSVPADTVTIAEIINKKRLRERVLMEYVKIIGYGLKYGISPI